MAVRFSRPRMERSFRSCRSVKSETVHVSTLRLVCESKIGDLLPDDAGDEDWEASGVLARDGGYYVAL